LKNGSTFTNDEPFEEKKTSTKKVIKITKTARAASGLSKILTRKSGNYRLN
jgi:hypothetical protein